MRNSFGRTQRLSYSKDFQRAFREGQRIKKSFFMAYAYSTPLNHGRLGVVIPKKVVALSTHRHRLKRIIRESFRLNQYKLVGYDIVIVLKAPPEHATMVWSALNQIWHILNIEHAHT